MAYGELLALTAHIGDIQCAQLAGAQAAPVEQQYDEPVASGRGPGDGGGVHQVLGLLQGEGLRCRAMERVLQTEAIEDVARRAAAAPGVLEKPTHVAQVLRKTPRRSALMTLALKPAQEVLECQ